MDENIGKDYVLPNGILLRPGGRVRVPRELIWAIPQSDVESYGIDIEHNEASPGSEVLVRRAPSKGGDV